MLPENSKHSCEDDLFFQMFIRKTDKKENRSAHLGKLNLYLVFKGFTVCRQYYNHVSIFHTQLIKYV